MPAMNEQDELRLLREQVAQLRERVSRVEEIVGAGSLPASSAVTQSLASSITRSITQSAEPTPRLVAPAQISEAPISAPEFRTGLDTQADSLERRIG